MTEVGEETPPIRPPSLADALIPLVALPLRIAAPLALFGFTGCKIVHTEPARNPGGAP